MGAASAAIAGSIALSKGVSGIDLTCKNRHQVSAVGVVKTRSKPGKVVIGPPAATLLEPADFTGF